MEQLVEISHKNAERIAVLESQFERHQEDRRADKQEQQETTRLLFAKLDEISTQITKQKGMIGGITLVFGGLATILYILKDWVFSHLK